MMEFMYPVPLMEFMYPVPLMEFMYPVSISMPCDITVGKSGLSCYVPCLMIAINSLCLLILGQIVDSRKI